MKVIRHGKPHGAYLRSLRKPSEQDYAKLVSACMEAIISGQENVLIAFSYVLKFPQGFPKGILAGKVDEKNIRRINARRLLGWLHENGHTNISVKDLKYQRVAFTRHIERFCGIEANLLAFDDLDVDESQDLVHNAEHQQREEDASY